MKGVWLDADTLRPEDLCLQPLQACFDKLTVHPMTTPEQIIERLQNADVAIVNKVRLDAQTLHALPNLKHILIAATGTNNVDLKTATCLNMSVQNCQGYGVNSVAQHTMMLILALSTRLLDYRQAIQVGDWSRSPFFCLLDFPVIELSGKTIGIIGYGALGQAVAKLAQAFGMKVVIAQLPKRAGNAGSVGNADRMPLATLLPQVDVLSIHCPLTPETTHLIAAQQLQWMRSSALLINCARGGIVNEQDLLQALQKQQIAGAATDVLTQEPPSAHHPMLAYQGNNLIITPHTAWASHNARQTIIDQLVGNMMSLKRGQPNFLVNSDFCLGNECQ